MGNVHMRFPEGKRKALTLSYDDAVLEDKRLIELMERYHICGTFNLFSHALETAKPEHNFDHVGARWTMEEAKELYSRPGIEVAIHGYTHPYLEKLPSDRCTYEILHDREVLEGLFGRPIRGMAYPFGTFNDQVVEIARRCGIAYSRTTAATGKYTFPECDWLRFPPTCHHKDPRLPKLTEDFLAETENWGDPLLLYVWGHTFEFHRENNWEIIENFCEKVAGHEDIWYATNIEIYDYYAAYRALQFSVRGDYVSNPSAIPVWFARDKKLYRVDPGKTIAIG